jgi:hypothetical protein
MHYCYTHQQLNIYARVRGRTEWKVLSSLAVFRKLFCKFYEGDFRLNLYMFSTYYITNVFTNVIQTPAGQKTVGVMQFKIKHLQVRPLVHASS